jgi:hypothetical protein
MKPRAHISVGALAMLGKQHFKTILRHVFRFARIVQDTATCGKNHRPMPLKNFLQSHGVTVPKPSIPKGQISHRSILRVVKL